MGIKLGSLDVSFRIGSADCKVYLGETEIYSGDTPTPPTPPAFSGKWLATYTGGTTSSAECESAEETIEQYEIELTDLVAVEIGDCVASIGDDSFRGCISLVSVTIPNSVTTIGFAAFRDCFSLSSVTIGSGVTSIGNSAFTYCTSLTSVTIPNNVTGIGTSAFNSCISLTSVTIPNSVTTIGSKAFTHCSGLTSVTIGSGVTSIGRSAFSGCTSLSSATIGNSVTSIGTSAFTSCSGLTSVTVLVDTPPTLGSNAFYNTDCPIYVPSASVSAYQSAWSDYASRIQAIPNDNQNPNQGGGEPNIGGFDDDEEIPDN